MLRGGTEPETRLEKINRRQHIGCWVMNWDGMGGVRRSWRAEKSRFAESADRGAASAGDDDDVGLAAVAWLKVACRRERKSIPSCSEQDNSRMVGSELQSLVPENAQR
jgi:hypothetical protein